MCLLRGVFCVCSQGGVSAPRGVCLLHWGSVCSNGCATLCVCVYPSMHPSCGQTDACKNITFATLLRTVTNTLQFNCMGPLNTRWCSCTPMYRWLHDITLSGNEMVWYRYKAELLATVYYVIAASLSFKNAILSYLFQSRRIKWRRVFNNFRCLCKFLNELMNFW